MGASEVTVIRGRNSLLFQSFSFYAAIRTFYFFVFYFFDFLFEVTNIKLKAKMEKNKA